MEGQSASRCRGPERTACLPAVPVGCDSRKSWIGISTGELAGRDLPAAMPKDV